MIQAARAGDRDAALALLAPATRDRLDAEARRATDLVGAAQRYTARELLSIGSSDGVADPSDITVIEERGDVAVVELVSPAGRARIDLIKVHGRWRIDLPQYSNRESEAATRGDL
jgi:hypothetical protein